MMGVTSIMVACSVAIPYHADCRTDSQHDGRYIRNMLFFFCCCCEQGAVLKFNPFGMSTATMMSRANGR